MQDESEGVAEAPQLGLVATTELMGVLVDRSRFDELDAVWGLRAGLLLCGYPTDSRCVAAADALEIVDWALWGAT